MMGWLKILLGSLLLIALSVTLWVLRSGQADKTPKEQSSPQLASRNEGTETSPAHARPAPQRIPIASAAYPTRRANPPSPAQAYAAWLAAFDTMSYEDVQLEFEETNLIDREAGQNVSNFANAVFSTMDAAAASTYSVECRHRLCRLEFVDVDMAALSEAGRQLKRDDLPIKLRTEQRDAGALSVVVYIPRSYP